MAQLYSPIDRPMPYKGTLKNMVARVLLNTMTTATTMKAYKEAVVTSIGVSITATTTGIFKDTTHTVDFNKGDALSTIVDTHSSATDKRIIVGVGYEYTRR
ncbi:MAG: hypothetical protein MUP55_02770 [Candidatus Aenigmarchaeota archaeon]|nr:hypothetical protein [Candidatus Aenigmarchaeota archaeon]